MKKKILCLLFVLSFVLTPLTSCLFIGDGEGIFLPEKDTVVNNTINVQGGPNYEKIEINSTADKNLLAASHAMLSTVSIRCSFTNSSGALDGSAGAGVIYSLDKERGDAYVITNYHVVYDTDANTENNIIPDIKLYLYGMEYMAEGDVSYAIPAKFVGGSMNHDIAVLKVTASTVLMESNAKAASFADSDKVSILETAIAIGNPGNGTLSATVGCINVDSEHITVKFDLPAIGNKKREKEVSLRVMRTDAAVNSGNSGGGLFNDKGELIGIVNAKDANMTVDNIGYAIPSNIARAVAQNVIENGSFKRYIFGIQVGSGKYWTKYDEQTGKIERFEQVVVSDLTTDTMKGKLNVGDIVNSITVDGVTTDVTRIHHVVDAMLYAREGDTVTMNITRGEKNMNVSVTVSADMLEK